MQELIYCCSFSLFVVTLISIPEQGNAGSRGLPGIPGPGAATGKIGGKGQKGEKGREGLVASTAGAGLPHPPMSPKAGWWLPRWGLTPGGTPWPLGAAENPGNCPISIIREFHVSHDMTAKLGLVGTKGGFGFVGQFGVICQITAPAGLGTRVPLCARAREVSLELQDLLEPQDGL